MAKPALQVFDDLPPWQYAALKASIEQFGVLLPIVKDEHGRIIDGHQRERACRELGIRDYPILTLAGLSREQERDHALLLNLVRRRISQEQMRGLIAAELRRTPDLSSNYLAMILGTTDKTVEAERQRLISTSEIPKFTKYRGRDGKARRSTRVISRAPREAERAQETLRQLGDAAPSGTASMGMLRNRVMLQKRAEYAAMPAARLPGNVTIEHADFRTWEGVRPGSVDLILTDPPWGDNVPVRQPFAEFAERVLKPGGFLLAYLGHYHLPDWLVVLRGHLTYRWLFAAVNDSAGTAGAGLMAQRIRVGWRPLALFSRGSPRLPMLVSDTIMSEAPEKGLHPWQQPISDATYYIESLCPPGGTVCDPFAGSGTVAAAVVQVGGGRRFIGCDKDAENVRVALRRVAEVSGAAETA